MTFIQAVLHAGIGYGIRRKAWPEDVWLIMDETRTRLKWKHVRNRDLLFVADSNGFHLSPLDLNADDWEKV